MGVCIDECRITVTGIKCTVTVTVTRNYRNFVTVTPETPKIGYPRSGKPLEKP